MAMNNQDVQALVDMAERGDFVGVRDHTHAMSPREVKAATTAIVKHIEAKGKSMKVACVFYYGTVYHALVSSPSGR